MLVLTRKVKESIIVGDDGPHRILKVTVLSIKGQCVKLGFEMDDHVSVHRWELWEEIRDAASLEAIERDKTPIDEHTWGNSASWSEDYEEVYEPQDVVTANN